MLDSIVVPVWVAIPIALFALWMVLEKLLVPSLRWFFRRRINRAITELNKSLRFEIPPLHPSRRKRLIDRLTYDAEVMQAVQLACEKEGAPYEAVVDRAAGYAREIVPAFNPYLYFKLVSGLCNAILSTVYRVRLGHQDEAGAAAIDRDSSIVLVINHRSNVDYLLVTLLALRGGALSYAVGEWARVWPLQQFIRALGGYFVRRGSGNPLYRKVLERYVQLSLDEGAVQAMFPEGGLSRDGALREPKLGLFDYMLRHFDVESSRDIVFIPVAVNYDRVLEDRTLLLDLDRTAERRSGWSAVFTALGFVIRNNWQRIRGKRFRYGYASANFGTPVSLRAHLQREGWNPAGVERDRRIAGVEVFANEMMSRIADLIPVLPVSAIAYLLLDRGEAALAEDELRLEAKELFDELARQGTHVYIPRLDLDYAVTVGLRMLTLRRVVVVTPQGLMVQPGQEVLLRYYANSISHLIQRA